MRLIGEIADPRQAEQFAAYLVTLGFMAKAERANQNKIEIWVLEEDHFKPARDELATFLANPSDPKYSRAVTQAQQVLRTYEDKQKRIKKKIIIGKRKLNPQPRATVTLIAICAFVALFTNFGRIQNNQIFKALAFNAVPKPDSLEILRQANSNLDEMDVRLASLKRGEVWRAITPIFIHHGTMHLLFNMIWLFQLGRMIEFRYGPIYYLALIVLSAAISNVVQCTVPLSWDGVPPYLTPRPELMLLTGMGGFSGVVYALFGFVWIKSVIDPSSRFAIPQSTVAIMLIWLVFCMLPGPNNNSLTEHLFGFRVANWAHAIGLLVGIVAAFLPTTGKK
jgi:GlpG protein